MPVTFRRFLASQTVSVFWFALLSCAPVYREGLPPGSPFLESSDDTISRFPHGIAVGDVTGTSAMLWLRTDRPLKVRIEYEPIGVRSVSGSGTASQAMRVVEGVTEESQDGILKLEFRDLAPATRYQVRVSAEGPTVGSAISAKAEFKTLPLSQMQAPVAFGWSGDLGGQTRCRTDEASYGIFSLMQRQSWDFFLFLGDTIYGDEICGPPNASGSDFKAVTLEQYRAKQRYQRGSLPLRRFLSTVPVYVTWDDHDVRNNFAGPYDDQMPAGRQALLDYWPIREQPEDPYRLYRSVRAGADLELFILDTRQYRSRNAQPDGPSKTMLGTAQLAWLLGGLRASTATWKVIASSVPLAVPKAGTDLEPGFDSWARGLDGTGFETELKQIAGTIVDQSIRNVVWLTGDVHFVQGLAFDVDRDGVPDFHEFTAGPLSAGTGRVTPVQSSFAVTTFISEGGYQNFGAVRVDGRTFKVTVIDESGRVRFTHQLQAR